MSVSFVTKTHTVLSFAWDMVVDGLLLFMDLFIFCCASAHIPWLAAALAVLCGGNVTIMSHSSISVEGYKMLGLSSIGWHSPSSFHGRLPVLFPSQVERLTSASEKLLRGMTAIRAV